MTIVIDNCLPLSWVEFLRQYGHAVRHWRELGPPNASDLEVMRWATENGAVILTQDLDFTKLLFQSRAALPASSNSAWMTCAPKTLARIFG